MLMSKKEIIDKFIRDPNFDEEASLMQRIEEFKTFFEKQIQCIRNIEDATMQAICICAFIDSLAQESEGYPREHKPAFYNFVRRHQKRCEYLEAIDPITLFYRVESLINESVLVDGFLSKKTINIEDMGVSFGMTMKDIINKGKAEEILWYVKNKKGVDIAQKYAEDHRLISLIYKMRSKAVHEMSGIGRSIKALDGDLPNEPYYMDIDRMDVDGEYIVAKNIIELVIPNSFLFNILKDCVDGYLSDCELNRRKPFSNNIKRKCHLSWYDN